MLLAPNVIEGYFIDDEIGKRTLNRELAGREITNDGDIVLAPNKPPMKTFLLVT